MSSRARVTLLATAVPVAMALIALLALSAPLVQADPGLSIYKDAPDMAIAGTELIYHISVNNDGITDTNTYVTDTLPAEVMYIADTGGCTEAGGVLTCPLGTLEEYEYRDFEVKVYVAPDAVAGEDDGTIVIQNTASVSSTEEYAETSEETFVEDLADLRVIKMSKPDTEIVAGEEFAYTIFVDNLGPSAARNVQIIDTLITEGVVDPTSCSMSVPSPTGIILFNCNFAANSGVWTLGSFGAEPLWPYSPDNTGRITIGLTAIALQGGDINNEVRVTADTPDPDQSNNVYYDFLSAEDVADLSIDKYVSECWYDGMDGEGGCVAGGYADFAISVSNNGPSTAENVVVEDLLPAGVTVVEVYGDGGCTTGIPGDPFAPLTCNLGNIPSGGRTSFNVEVQIDPDYVDAELPFDSRPLENDAWVYSDVFDDDNSNNRDFVIEDIYTLSQLAITKWGFPEVAGVGDDVEYEIRIWNFGPSTADTVQFADLLPPTVDYNDYYIEQGTGTCVYHDPLSHPWWDEYRGVHCYVDEIPPNGVVMVHLLGTYNEDLWWAESPEETCNIIPDDDPFSFWDDDWGIEDPWTQSGWWADSYIVIPWENSTFEGNEGDYFGWCPDELYVEADLAITKTSEPMKLYPGEQKLYHIEVTNNGPTGAAEVMVTDTLPVSVTYEIDNGNCDLVGQNPDVLECYLGNMMPGETKAFDVWALVSRDAPPGEITNEAHVVMGGEMGGYDPNEENNWAYATNLVLVPTVADLSLQKSWGEAPPDWFQGGPYGPEDCYLYDEGMNLYGIRAGCPLTFSLTISNTGPLLAENVVVEDAMPAGVTVEGVGPSQGSCTTGIPGDPAAPLTCNLGNIPRDEGATIEVFVRTDADLPWGEHLENDAVVSSDIPDPDNGNNRAHVLIFVEPFSYLYLDKEGPTEIMAGEQIEYWINLRNEGPSTAQDVHLEDELPGGVSLLGAEVMIGDGSCAPDSTLCSLGDMEPWDNRAVRVRGYVEPWLEAETIITNTARAWAESPYFQPVPGQPISDTVETLVHSAADLSIRKTADPYKVYAGEQVRYDVSVTNNGPSVAHNVVVTDTLDPGVEYEIDTDSCQIIYSESITPTMFGSTQPYYEGELFTVDLGTGAGNFVGYMPEYLAAEVEYDNTSGRLFASMGFRPWSYEGGYPRLYELDPNTGASLGYVELDYRCSLPGLEFVDGTLYGTCSAYQGMAPDLFTIDPDTGEMGHLGYTDLGDMVHGLAYDESSDIMYGLVVTYPNQLVTIDLDDGEAHWLCDIWDDDYGYEESDLRALEFGPDGTLYGGIAYDSDLVVIDPNPVDGYCPMTHVGDTGFSITGLTLADMRVPLGVECSLGDIAPGETSSFSIWARVKPDTLGIINNRVDVISETYDPNPDNDWDTEANLVLGKADLKVTKFGKPDGQVRAGDELEYWVVVDNLGPGYAHEVVLRDLISSDGAFELWWGEDDGDGDEYSCQVYGDCYCEGDWCDCYEDVRLTCRLDDPLPVMTPDDAGRWLLKVWVEAQEQQSINNLARVVSHDFDPDLSNNEAFAEHDITAVADLELNKIAEGEVLVGCEGETELWENEVAAGGMLYYTLQIYNDGPSEAENVVVEDWGLSPFLDIVDVECIKDDEEDECSCNLSGLGELGDTNRHLVCYLGTIEEDDEDEIIITARIPSDVPEGTRMVNDAQVYSDVFDDYNGNNLDSNWTYVSRWADLEVVKTQAPEIALPGWDISYTITVTNLGLSDVEGVFISDTLPVQVLNPTWTCCASDGSCDCPCEVPVCPPGECPWPDIGLFAQADIPAGEWVIYTVEGTLDVWPCGPFTNTVELIPPQSLLHPDVDIDPCDENNVAEAVNNPFCHFDPLVLKAYPGSDSPP